MLFLYSSVHAGGLLTVSENSPILCTFFSFFTIMKKNSPDPHAPSFRNFAAALTVVCKLFSDYNVRLTYTVSDFHLQTESQHHLYKILGYATPVCMDKPLPLSSDHGRRSLCGFFVITVKTVGKAFRQPAPPYSRSGSSRNS